MKYLPAIITLLIGVIIGETHAWRDYWFWVGGLAGGTLAAIALLWWLRRIKRF